MLVSDAGIDVDVEFMTMDVVDAIDVALIDTVLPLLLDDRETLCEDDAALVTEDDCPTTRGAIATRKERTLSASIAMKMEMVGGDGGEPWTLFQV